MLGVVAFGRVGPDSPVSCPFMMPLGPKLFPLGGGRTRLLCRRAASLTWEPGPLQSGIKKSQRMVEGGNVMLGVFLGREMCGSASSRWSTPEKCTSCLARWLKLSASSSSSSFAWVEKSGPWSLVCWSY